MNNNNSTFAPQIDISRIIPIAARHQIDIVWSPSGDKVDPNSGDYSMTVAEVPSKYRVGLDLVNSGEWMVDAYNCTADIVDHNTAAAYGAAIVRAAEIAAELNAATALATIH